MKLIRTLILFVTLLLSTFLFSQDNLEFKNSTPRETVQSHLSFLKGENYNPKIAAFTLGVTKFSAHKNEMLVIKLKEIIESYGINTDEVLDRKKGIVERDKYILFNKHPQIYLVREQRSWVYSPETVKAINSIYDRDILHLEKNEKVDNKSEEVLHLIKADTTEKNEFDLSTPYNAVLTHLIFTTDSMFDPIKAAKTIRFLDRDSSKAESMAIKLSQLFLGSSKKVFDFESISKDSNYVDSLTQKHIFYPNETMRQLYLEKVGDDWLYSVETSQLINSAHEEMFSEKAEEIFNFSDRFKRWSGQNYRKSTFGIEKWQWLMFFFFIIIFILIWVLSRFILKKIIYMINYFDHYKSSFHFLIKNILFVSYLYISKTYIPSLELGVEYGFVIPKIFAVLIILFNTLISLNILNLVLLFLTKDQGLNSKKGVLTFVSLIIKLIIFVACVLFVINELEYNLVNVLAGLSIGGFAIALGAQDTVKNFFGSLMIFADQPFAVGDFITDGEIMGTVEEVGIRTTRIRTAYSSLITVPNSKLADNNVDNWGKREYRRYKSKITLEYDTSSKLLQQFIEALKEEILNQPNTRKDYYVITVNDFSLYGIEVLINVFFIAPTWGLEMEARQHFILRALEIAKELGIEYAKPPR